MPTAPTYARQTIKRNKQSPPVNNDFESLPWQFCLAPLSAEFALNTTLAEGIANSSCWVLWRLPSGYRAQPHQSHAHCRWRFAQLARDLFGAFAQQVALHE